MAKRSTKSQMDIVTEAQQNSRWFGGRRKYAFPMDRTPAEWSRGQRYLFSRSRANLILLIASGIPFLAICILVIINDGVSHISINTAAFMMIMGVIVVLSIVRLLRKD